MSYGIKLKVWGDYACFTRPELKVERVSYDIITPSAARGILDAIYWHPSMKWVVDCIHVLNPIRFENIRKNEVGEKISDNVVKEAIKTGYIENLRTVVDDARQQRAALVLRDVAYVIEAHFELSKNNTDDSAKHYNMFRRRAQKGQCYHRPSLGLREFVANFEWVERIPNSTISGSHDLGLMLYDINYERDRSPMFFRAEMVEGVVDIAAARERGLVQ